MPDILKDHMLWADILALCGRRKDDGLKIIMEALRRAECPLWLEDGRLCFRFNRDNLNGHMIQRAKQTLAPFKAILKAIFEKVAEKHIKLDPKDWKEYTPF